MDTLCFRLPGHGDTTLKHMNSLRSGQQFCDITIVASNNQTFRGHKVVLAACSPFLRDQFLLNPSSKLQVSMLYSSTVVCDLLLSCYTGVLQFNPEEIVNYLTAASYLQMEHIVERCRGALKKYMQLKNPSPQKKKSQESQSRVVVVSGSTRAVASMSPPASRGSHSPAACSVDESNGEASTQTTNPHQNETALLDVKVNLSDEEEAAKEQDYDVFRVYIAEEAQGEDGNKDGEEERAANSDEAREMCYSETEGVMMGESSGFASNATQDDFQAGGPSGEEILLEGLPMFRRKLTESKFTMSRGHGRGKGFKRRRWGISQEKRSSITAQQADLWCFSNGGLGTSIGLDYSQEGLKTGRHLSIDLSRVDFGMTDTLADHTSANGMAQYSLEESNGCSGDGSSGLAAVASNEGGDESVAVVGSTSSVMGPVICEHCGMTFPSPHSLAIHSRSTHMLHVCPCCGKHFHHSGNLNRHMAVHRGTGKSHQCPLCYKTFTQKSTLIDHMNLHSGERPHRCAYCHARFAHKPALRRHLKEQHGKTTGQNSLYEQEEREREREQSGRAGGRIREEEQECLVTEQVS